MRDNEGYQDFYNDMQLWGEATQIVCSKIELVAEITFYNKGTSTMVVNNIPFLPGTGIAFDGKHGMTKERDRTKYSITFTGAGINSAFVIRKCYIG